ncbi:MAG: helix-turn-helix domain-containing protein [Thiomicrospira sp.]|nr:helix-turn-helix domain-containing protein [Thiomicrospira sp.]NCN65907.1 helix-turn-helix domain-containing protein [Thiomicrospira sp.]NCO14377.1 helix-turn-helix domain-containing protein [Thiomicrospira sp.]NCO81045.1 helix-turn-helix domain-containing protein [Thiomicrospira sp.]NCP58057.1 helix-turn-helix domain-containing protein [Thiomicrospira sp.]
MTGRIVSLLDISEATEIGCGTLSKIANQKDANITIDKVEKICKFFVSRIDDLIDFYDFDTEKISLGERQFLNFSHRLVTRWSPA